MRPLLTGAWAGLSLVLLAHRVRGDEILLSSGGRINGVIVERSATTVTIEIGAGRVSLPASRVMRVVEGESALSGYRQRALGLAPQDAPGWLQLALWAQDHGLQTQAGDAFSHVLTLDPQNAAALAALRSVGPREAGVEPESPEQQPSPSSERELELEQAALARAAEQRTEAAGRIPAERAEPPVSEAESAAQMAEPVVEPQPQGPAFVCGCSIPGPSCQPPTTPARRHRAHEEDPSGHWKVHDGGTRGLSSSPSRSAVGGPSAPQRGGVPSGGLRSAIGLP